MESFSEKVGNILKLQKPASVRLEELIEERIAEKREVLGNFVKATGGIQVMAALVETLKRGGFLDVQMSVGLPRKNSFITAVVWDFHKDTVCHLCRAIILEVFDPETKRAQINGADLENLTGQEGIDKPRIEEEILRAVRDPKIINLKSHQFSWINQIPPSG